MAKDQMTTSLPFHQLNEGDKYLHRPGGKVEQVVEKKEAYMLIRRDDGWLIPCRAGDYVWDKVVIKV